MKRFIVLAIAISFSSLNFAQEKAIQPESIFAIVTHKAGMLSGLGHDHFIHAGNYQAKAMLDESDLSSFRFEMSFSVEDLVVDDASQKQKWFPQIKSAAVLDEEFSEVSDKNRRKITKSMLGKKQLNAKKFPQIKAWVEGVKEKKGQVGEIETNVEITLKMEIKQQQKTYTMPAKLSFESGTLQILAIGPMKFTDFGIEPFSAMLGSVANDNRFHIFVNLVAK